LKDSKAKFHKYVEVDFSSVTAKKIRQIRKPGSPDLVAMFSEKPSEFEHSDLHAGDYQLLGADLRQPKELKSKLEASGLDFDMPTLFIAECVLVYMSAMHSGQLLNEIATWFKTALFVNYEQVEMGDTFGGVMERNLQQRGIILPGLSSCKSLESQKQRFLDNKWESVNIWTMSEIYKTKLPKNEVTRIEAIEFLDERELLVQLLDHYCISIAFKDSSSKYSHLKDVFS
uniref:[phosphatase 2A protein]-leucine-carboxy methyltransferase n=1 Tax=Anisakis simplex TaxID=6269 RepID=A0A0M3K9W0_ANISI